MQLADGITRFKAYLPLLILILIFFVGFFLLKPNFFEMLGLRKVVVQSKADLNSQQKDLSILNEAQQRYEAEMSELQKTQDMLPDKEKLPELLVQFENMAVGNGLILGGLNFGGQGQGTGSAPEQAQTSNDKHTSIKVGTLQQSSQFLEGDSAAMNVALPADQTDNMPGAQNQSVDLITMLSKEPVQALDVSANVTGSYENFKKFLRDMETNMRLIDINHIEFNSPSGGEKLYQFNISAKVYYQ